MSFSNDDLLKYLQLNPQGPQQPFDLGSALGMPQAQAQAAPVMPSLPPPPPAPPIGAAPGLDIGSLLGPGPPPSMTPPPAPPPPKPAKLAAPGKVTPQSIAGMRDQAYADQVAGVQGMANAKGAQMQVQGQGEITAAQQLEKRQQEDTAVTAAATQQANEKAAALQKEMADFSATKIDRNRLVNNMSTFEKITSVIALGLGGGYSARHIGGVNRGPQSNPMLEMLTGQINKDIQAQMADLDTRKSGINMKGTMLQQEIAQGRDAAEARTKATLALYDNTIREVNGQVKMMGTATAQAEGQQLISGLEGQKEKEVAAYHQQEVANGIQFEHLRLAKQQAGVENALKFAQLPGQLAEQPVKLAGDIADTQYKQAQIDALKHKGGAAAALNPERAIGNIGQPELDPKGQPTGRMTWGAVEAPIGGKEQVGKVNEKIGEITPVIQALDEQIKDAHKLGIAEKLGASVAGEGTSDIIQRMNARKVQLLQLEHMLAGRVTEQGLDELKKAAGDPTAFISRIPKMQEFREQIRLQAQAALGGVGVKDHWEPPSAEAPLRAGMGNNAAALPPDQADLRRSIALGQGPGGSPTVSPFQNVQAAGMSDVVKRLQAEEAAKAASSTANADYMKYLGLY